MLGWIAALGIGGTIKRGWDSSGTWLNERLANLADANSAHPDKTLIVDDSLVGLGSEDRRRAFRIQMSGKSRKEHDEAIRDRFYALREARNRGLTSHDRLVVVAVGPAQQDEPQYRSIAPVEMDCD